MPKRAACAGLLLAGLVGLACLPAFAGSVQLDDLTWTEVRDGLRAGTTTVIIPVGGTEQNGPHMALGKHNVRAAALSARIAAKLGRTLVAPVMPYVPEGRISPPAGHMRFPGTISVPEDAFAAVLAGAARSLRQHGFLDIVLVGDSGNYQRQLKDIAARLNREWAGTGTRAHYVAAYYDAGTAGFARALRARGITETQLGTHAGLADTSLLMAIDESRVRADRLAAPGAADPSVGVTGEPSQASAALGRIGVDMIIDTTAAAIRLGDRRPQAAGFQGEMNEVEGASQDCSHAGGPGAAREPGRRAARRCAAAGAVGTGAPCVRDRWRTASRGHRARHARRARPGQPLQRNRRRQASPAVAGALERIYVPNRAANSVSVIDPATLKVVDTFKVGVHPQHITPSWDLKMLWVSNNAEGRTDGSMTPIDPKTGKPGASIPIDDPYNLYLVAGRPPCHRRRRGVQAAGLS